VRDPFVNVALNVRLRTALPSLAQMQAQTQTQRTASEATNWGCA
jgi:hypothetical protein